MTSLRTLFARVVRDAAPSARAFCHEGFTALERAGIVEVETLRRSLPGLDGPALVLGAILLARDGHAESRDAVLALLETGRADQVGATHALTQFPDAGRTHAVCLRLLHSPDAEAHRRAAAAHVVDVLCHEPAVDALISLLREPALRPESTLWSEAIAAAASLAQTFGRPLPEDVLRVAVAALASPSPDTRCTAAWVVGMQRCEAARPALQRLQEDPSLSTWHERIADAAREALDRLDAREPE